MEWDKMADRWADMTHRLRRGKVKGPLNISDVQDAGRAKSGVERQPPERQAHEPVGNDSSLPPNQ